MKTQKASAVLSLFPLTARINAEKQLCIGGCNVVNLAREFSTPLYLFDEFTIRHQCREFAAEFSKYYPGTQVIYASKAFLNRSLVLLLHEEGLGLDAVSAGEISIMNSVNFPLDKVYFHGNNKTPAELNLALDLRVGHIVADNLQDISTLDKLAGEKKVKQKLLLRLTPNVDPHTHQYTTTGVLDSKFGLPIVTGQAEEAVKQAMAAPNLSLVGLHFHLGSPIFETEPYEMAMEIVLRFAREMKQLYNFHLEKLSIGGGFAVPYTAGVTALSISNYAANIAGKLNSLIAETGLARPELIIEPGRSLVAQAGVALYQVGTIKEIPGVRKYVALDGGMSDNIRPALYGAKYEALVANKALEDTKEETVTLVGKMCESGDIIIRDISLPQLVPGDIIAVPVCGAYSVPMWNNYNASLKPAIIMLKEGSARLIQRRENYHDLLNLDTI